MNGNYDAAIVGGGPVGLSVAKRCSKLGLSAVLIEKNPFGETNKTWSDFPKNIKAVGLEDAVMHTSTKFTQRAYTGLASTIAAEMVFLDEEKTFEILRSGVSIDILDECQAFAYDNNKQILTTTKGNFRVPLLIDASGYKTKGDLDSQNGLTFDQFGLKKDIVLQTFAYVCQNTNVDQQNSIMFDLPFATDPRVWYWINPLGEKKAWIGAMYICQQPLPWPTIRKRLKRYMASQGIEAKITEEKKGFIPSFRLENQTRIHANRVLHAGDTGPGAVSGTFFGFVTGINHGEHIAEVAKTALDTRDFTKEFFREEEQAFYPTQTRLNYLLGIVGEKVIIGANDQETSKLLALMNQCGDETVIKRLETNLNRADVLKLTKALLTGTTLKEKLKLIPQEDRLNFLKYVGVLASQMIFAKNGH